MGNVWAIPTIASILILTTFGSSQDVFALSSQTPEKIRIDGVNWNANSQAFEVELSVQLGIATAGENADFQIQTILESDIGMRLVSQETLGESDVGSGTEYKSKKILQIIPWDGLLPDGTPFEGVLSVDVTSQLLNPAGQTISNPSSIHVMVIIPQPTHGVLSVEVLDADTRFSVENYQVDIFNEDGRLVYSTINSGPFHTVLLPGRYQATFQHDDYLPEEVAFDIVLGLNRITVELEPKSVPNIDELIPIRFHFPEKDVQAFTDPSTFEFSFNPTEYIVLKKTPWKHHDTPSVDTPNLEFTIGEPMRMNVELFFDTFEEKKDVRELTKKIESLAQVNPEIHRPPQCLFTWGNLEFKCVLESFSTRYTLFLDNGTPVRAVMNVSFKEFKPANEQLNSYILKKHEALELLDASNESIPLLRSYQTSSFHDVVDQLFGDLVGDDDLPPVDDVSLDDTLTNSLDFLEPDVPVIVKGFKIEIKGQKQGQSEDNEWKTVSGGTLNIEIADSSVGTDQFHTTTPGHKFIDELTLKGPMTDKRKPLSDWISDGSLDKCNECKNVTFLFFDENGNTVFENQIRVIDSYYFRNQVFLLSIQDDNRLHATVLDVARTDSSGNQYTGAPRIFVVLPTSSPSFMPVGIGGSGFAVPTVPYVNGVPSISIFNFQIQNIPLIGSISVGFTIVPPAAPSGQSNLQVEYLGQRSNPFPFSVN